MKRTLRLVQLPGIEEDHLMRYHLFDNEDYVVTDPRRILPDPILVGEVAGTKPQRTSPRKVEFDIVSFSYGDDQNRRSVTKHEVLTPKEIFCEGIYCSELVSDHFNMRVYTAALTTLLGRVLYSPNTFDLQVQLVK